MTAWLLTVLVHSTLWCGIAWLCLRLFPRTHARLRETIWYTALAASFITPTVHSFTSPESAIWRLPMPSFIAGGEQGHSEGEPDRDDMSASVPAPSGEEAHGEEAAVNARLVGFCRHSVACARRCPARHLPPSIGDAAATPSTSRAGYRPASVPCACRTRRQGSPGPAPAPDGEPQPRLAGCAWRWGPS